MFEHFIGLPTLNSRPFETIISKSRIMVLFVAKFESTSPLHSTKNEFIFIALNEAQVPAAHSTSTYPRIFQRSAPGHASCTLRTSRSSCSPKDHPGTISFCRPLPLHRYSRIASLFPYLNIPSGGSHPLRSSHQGGRQLRLAALECIILHIIIMLSVVRDRCIREQYGNKTRHH